ncbi:MAG: hypothetical protein QOH12_1295 [Solirubrobacteraceae bacterium]|jgi:hypothetical protein|nr:hypothetical protein [Solirubrobacteraceae bacterium]
MPTRAVFHCQFCDAVPDHGTQRSLAGQVSERMFGEYLDAFPGRWLVWNGGGPLGPRRYACREHRGDLVAYLRYHYATVAAQVWKMPPYTQRWPDEKRPNMGGSMGIIKFGLRGGLLQERPIAGRGPQTGPARGEIPPEEVAVPFGGTPPAGGEGEPADAPPAPAPIAEGPAPGETISTGEGPAAGEVVLAGESATPGLTGPPQEPGLPGDAPGPDALPADGETSTGEEFFPPGDLLLPDDWDPTGELFPPGELFLPTDGLFAPEDESQPGPRSSKGPGDGEDAWPPDDEDPPEDDGAWPTPPANPPPPPA